MKKLTLNEYVRSVEDTLQYWLDVHTNPLVWAKHWLGGDDYSTVEEFKEKLIEKNFFVGNVRFFRCNIRNDVYHTIATQKNVMVCPKCNHVEEYGKNYKCSHCEANTELVNVTPNDVNLPFVIDYLITNFTSKEILDLLQIEDLINIMCSKVFPIYWKYIKHKINGIIEDVEQTLAFIRNAKNNEERLVFVLYGTCIYHTCGIIFDDYYSGSSVISEMINNVRNNGLESVFDREDIYKYVSLTEI